MLFPYMLCLQVMECSYFTLHIRHTVAVSSGINGRGTTTVKDTISNIPSPITVEFTHLTYSSSQLGDQR